MGLANADKKAVKIVESNSIVYIDERGSVNSKIPKCNIVRYSIELSPGQKWEKIRDQRSKPISTSPVMPIEEIVVDLKEKIIPATKEVPESLEEFERKRIGEKVIGSSEPLKERNDGSLVLIKSLYKDVVHCGLNTSSRSMARHYLISNGCVDFVEFLDSQMRNKINELIIPLKEVAMMVRNAEITLNKLNDKLNETEI